MHVSGTQVCDEKNDTASQTTFFTAAPLPTHAPAPRFLFLDSARGLLIFLMVSSHAVTLANVSETSFLQSALWLPRGWATQNFSTLAGFTVAWLYAASPKLPRAHRRLFQRMWQLLAVMFVSNIVFLLFRYCALHELARVWQWSWWKGLITFSTEYSVSGALLPIAAFLLLAPALLTAARSWKLRMLVPGLFVCAVAVWAIHFYAGGRGANSRLVEIALLTGAGGYSVLPLASNGGLGFALGLLWRCSAPYGRRMWLVASGSTALLEGLSFLLRQTALSPAARGLAQVVTVTAHFQVLLMLSFCFERGALGRATRWLCQIGKYALFCFIAHRIVMQTLVLVSARIPGMSPDVLYWVYFAVTLSTLCGLCLLRDRSPLFTRALNRVYL